jgi:hypothetical protein
MMISFRNLPFEQIIEKQKQYGLDYATFISMSKRRLAPFNLDSDNLKQTRKIVRKLKKSKYNKGGYQVLWRKSSSRRGIHFTIFENGMQCFMPKPRILRIRRLYNDCYGRINCDKIRILKNRPISILFYHKNSKSATAWRDLSQLKL